MHARRTLLLGCLLFSACDGQEEPAPNLTNPLPSPPPPSRPSPEPATLREHLERGIEVELDPSANGFALAARPASAEPSMVSAEVGMLERGRVSLDARGRLTIDLLSLAAADIEVSPAAFPPSGLHLTGISATFGSEPLALEWAADGARASFSGELSLTIRWALVGRDGQPIALRPIEIDALWVEGVVAEENGRMVIDFGGEKSGTLLSIREVAELSDLSFGLRLLGP
jgi:hypothetical protein